MAQSIGPLLSQIASSPTIRRGAEMTMKQIENLSPPIMKQVLPLVEQLPPLYMDLVKGREDFIPKPEETQRLVCQISNFQTPQLLNSLHTRPIICDLLEVFHF
ncbi:hypothetical protein SLEP1_g43398 [Rubroshorea leprosula]|uniref:Uncharacterized protein n=1 Tax=Rubroshorea leprosula TaxID=152421 RepID=A0AAV5LDE0_9ROSI|nr:hypothetical protein SLEP1_g43398 [Rubroshorea leprosula]